MSIELLIEEERKSIKQIEDATTKAEKRLADSQKEAQKILDQAIKKEFIQKYLQKEEEKVNEEAKKVLNKYKKDVAKIEKIPSNKIQKMVDRILNEVLKI
jgi:vacuolar-type H+-ATPase subunit H